jgi:hypothetical protein
MIPLHLRRQRILGDFSESSARYLGNVRILNSKGLQNTIKRMQNLITHHLPLPSSLTHRLCRIPQSNIMASRLFYNTNSELERDIVEPSTSGIPYVSTISKEFNQVSTLTIRMG